MVINPHLLLCWVFGAAGLCVSDWGNINYSVCVHCVAHWCILRAFGQQWNNGLIYLALDAHTHNIHTFLHQFAIFSFSVQTKIDLDMPKKKHHGVSIWRKLMLSNMTHKGLLNLSTLLVRTSCMLLKLTWYCWLYNCNIHLICLRPS